jgi:transposase
MRSPRHESVGLRQSILELETRKWRCLECGKSFWQRFPGLLARFRATEPFRKQIFQRHFDGISRSRLGQREGISGTTVERWSADNLKRLDAERASAQCPKILGIDEHFFTRRKGYATTFCDLAKHRVFDVVAGRSEKSLEHYLDKLPGKERVKVICMDLSPSYRVLAEKYFPKARIVADRFHVIRLIGHHFLSVWRLLDPKGSKNRGLVSLMRRHDTNLKPEQKARLEKYLQDHPAQAALYAFKQRLCALLLPKGLDRHQCRKLAPLLLDMISQLRRSPFAPLATLGETLWSWKDQIATMWRFSRNNGITEGFHTKIEVLQRQAYGFRNFQNYRLRVRVLCWSTSVGGRGRPH